LYTEGGSAKLVPCVPQWWRPGPPEQRHGLNIQHRLDAGCVAFFPESTLTSCIHYTAFPTLLPQCIHGALPASMSTSDLTLEGNHPRVHHVSRHLVLQVAAMSLGSMSFGYAAAIIATTLGEHSHSHLRPQQVQKADVIV